MSSLADKGLTPGKPVSFTVRYNGARGALHAKVIPPGGDEEDAGIQEVDEADQYVVRFIPRENGPHLVHVLLETEHMPGSPFLFLVGKYDAGALARVDMLTSSIRGGGRGQARQR